jgi:hypothetical protein
MPVRFCQGRPHIGLEFEFFYDNLRAMQNIFLYTALLTSLSLLWATPGWWR